MIYAIRKHGRRETLIEASRAIDLQFADRPIAANVARKWVLDGKEHETGLWVDDGKVRYARSEKAKVEGEQDSPSAQSAPSFDPLLGSGGLPLEQGSET